MKKDFLDSTNNFIGILVGLASAISAIVPIFSTKFLEVILIDKPSIQLISLIGLLLLLFTAWFSTSLDFFIFLRNDLSKLSRFRFYSLITLFASVVIEYLLNLLYTSNNISFELASILQIIAYLTFFLASGIHIGIAVQTSSQTRKNINMEENFMDIVKDTITKSGYVPSLLKINSISKYDNTSSSPDMYGAYYITAEIKDENFIFIISNNLRKVLVAENKSKAPATTYPQ